MSSAKKGVVEIVLLNIKSDAPRRDVAWPAAFVARGSEIEKLLACHPRRDGRWAFRRESIPMVERSEEGNRPSEYRIRRPSQRRGIAGRVRSKG